MRFVTSGFHRLATLAGSVLPESRGPRLALVGLLVAIGAGAWAANYYLADKPQQLADEYRKAAQPAADEVADAMDQVYTSLDRFIVASQIPKSELRHIDDFQEFKRRVLPVLSRADDALGFARRAIRNARQAFAAERSSLGNVEAAPFLDSKQPLKDADAAAKAAHSYLSRSENYLRTFQRFVDYTEKDLALQRRSIESTARNEIEASDDLEAIKASVASELEETSEIRRQLLHLKPHTSMKRMHQLSIEESTILVDYLEDVQTALDNLSIVGLEAADAELLIEIKGFPKRYGDAWDQFVRNSSLQRTTRRLSQQAQKLEESIGDLGSGFSEAGEFKRSRPKPPKETQERSSPPGQGEQQKS